MFNANGSVADLAVYNTPISPFLLRGRVRPVDGSGPVARGAADEDGLRSVVVGFNGSGVRGSLRNGKESARNVQNGTHGKQCRGGPPLCVLPLQSLSSHWFDR